jgi:cysteine desulfurase
MDTIYFDNAATTRICAAAQKEIERAERELYFNSAALYGSSLNVKREIERAKDIIRKRITRSGEGELVFTSGATEGNNMAVFGKITNPRQHFAASAGEHSSVYSPSVYLKQNNFEVDYVPLLSDGQIDTDSVKRRILPNTALFAFGMVNSDTGTLQNAAEIVRAVKAVNPRTHVHCDAVQAFCKFDFDAASLGLDSCVVSAHKIYGPKGIGALWLRKGVTLKPLMLGGAQQEYRPGTENNPAILGFAAAVQNFDTAKYFGHVKQLHTRLIRGLPASCTINGNNQNPYITNIQLPTGILGQTVLNALSAKGICVGLGSACASTASKNRTLLAMGIPETRTKEVLRVSFGIYNTIEEVDVFLDELKKVLESL